MKNGKNGLRNSRDQLDAQSDKLKLKLYSLKLIMINYNGSRN